jgi:hypothetical protein
VSSQTREYLPTDFVDPHVIVSGSAQFIDEATLWTFGMLSSKMHMAWLASVGGRTKSDFQYTTTMVYNTFPWPEASPAQISAIEALAQAVLGARAAWPTSSLADLYDPDTMPPNLRKAHTALDAAVDRLYRKKPFDTDRDRVEHLFGLYEKLVAPLEADAEKQNKRYARRVKKGTGD